MAPIPSEQSAQFCIDAFEASVVTERNAEGQVVTRAESKPGVQPAEGLTWYAAKAACEATPVLRSGVVVGHKRLARSQEWADAGDGVIGKDGPRFPWGAAADPRRCFVPGTPLPAGVILHAASGSGAAPTGSFPACKSGSGVFDQIGNVWEWTDPERSYAHAAALATMPGGGLEVGVNGQIRVLASATVTEPPPLANAPRSGHEAVAWAVAGFDCGDASAPVTLSARIEAQWPEAPTLVAWGSCVVALFPAVRADGPPTPPLPLTGWLHVGNGEALAVGFDQHAPSGSVATGTVAAAVRANPAYDGSPLTDKRGGAYYTAGNVGLQEAYYGHPPDFFGSIGFRCASD
jgi:hypothetical protein